MRSDVHIIMNDELESPTNVTSYNQSNFSSLRASPGMNSSNPTQPIQNRRRFSRFDPMGRGEEEGEEEGYGDLGGKHPLRRVAEEDGREDLEDLHLPGIKALFGTTGQDHTFMPPFSRSNSGSLFQSPSLPSLHSPNGSPSIARSSRYSSLASSSTPSTTDSFSPDYQGWWAPDPSPGPSRHTPPNSHRTYSQPTIHTHNTHPEKRRRSDGPPALRDAEESARLRWQAQSRNASFPNAAGSISGPSGAYQGGFRTLYPPPTMLSRGSVSGQGDSPVRPVQGRNMSIVGGQLSQTFADLTANEKRRDSTDMPPPVSRNTDRRASHLPAQLYATQEPHRLDSVLPIPTYRRSPNPQPPYAERPGGVHRRKSMTRPASPEGPITSRPMARRSSISDDILLKMGHSLPKRTGSRDSTPKPDFRPSFDDTFPSRLHGWGRRSSGDSHVGINLISEGEGSRKRSGEDRGMEMLVEVNANLKDIDEGRDDAPAASIPGPKYMCEYCAKTFTRPSSLRIHVYSHTGERPFVCQEPSCKRSFSVQSNLKRHAKVHQVGGSAQYREQQHDPGIRRQGEALPPREAGAKAWDTGEDGDGDDEDEEMVDELEDDE